MTQSTIALTLGNITVRQHNGLFSLNDLHKASGGEENFKPAFFLRNDQAKALITEIANGADLHLFLNTTKGRNGSTYACRELVIAYAAWISAAFHLKVIRVFLAATTPQAEPTQTRLDYDRISPAQAQDLKEIVAAIVQAGIQGYAETWSRLQRKFRVNSYLELPAQHYGDAWPTCWPSYPPARPPHAPQPEKCWSAASTWPASTPTWANCATASTQWPCPHKICRQPGCSNTK